MGNRPVAATFTATFIRRTRYICRPSYSSTIARPTYLVRLMKVQCCQIFTSSLATCSTDRAIEYLHAWTCIGGACREMHASEACRTYPNNNPAAIPSVGGSFTYRIIVVPVHDGSLMVLAWSYGIASIPSHTQFVTL